MILQRVCHTSVLPRCRVHRMRSYQWLSEAQFCREALAAELPSPFICRLEEIAHKVARGAGVGRGAEGQQHEGHVQGCCALAVALQHSQWRLYVPLDFISCVQTWISSCISSGATSLRDHDSSHRGFGCATGSAWFPALDADRGPSFDLKTFLKKGIILRGRGEPHVGSSGIRYWRQMRAGRGAACCVGGGDSGCRVEATVRQLPRESDARGVVEQRNFSQRLESFKTC